MINQLTLGVGLKDEATFENYYPGKNQLLVDELKKTIAENGERVIYFYGSFGEGRTHLLQAVCHEADQAGRRALYIPLENINDFSPEIFQSLETVSLVCIDDLHKMAGRKDWEEAFFHAYNRIHDAGGSLIVTANQAPKSLGLTMPDVVSRLEWGIVFHIQALSDEEKVQILSMRAARRGMTLVEEVARFILKTCPRHMTTLFSALDTLDKASLSAQRKLTIPFVKEVLQI